MRVRGAGVSADACRPVFRNTSERSDPSEPPCVVDWLSLAAAPHAATIACGVGFAATQLTSITAPGWRWAGWWWETGRVGRGQAVD